MSTAQVARAWQDELRKRSAALSGELDEANKKLKVAEEAQEKANKELKIAEEKGERVKQTLANECSENKVLTNKTKQLEKEKKDDAKKIIKMQASAGKAGEEQARKREAEAAAEREEEARNEPMDTDAKATKKKKQARNDKAAAGPKAKSEKEAAKPTLEQDADSASTKAKPKKPPPAPRAAGRRYGSSNFLAKTSSKPASLLSSRMESPQALPAPSAHASKRKMAQDSAGARKSG